MQGVVFQLFVKTNAQKFAIISLDRSKKVLKITVKSKAIKGKANQEIIKEFKRKFNVDVCILRGETSSKKLVSFSGLLENVLLRKLSEK